MAATHLIETHDLLALVQAAEDDTDESPWMTMPEFQYFVIHLLASILRWHNDRHRLGWHVSAELGVSMPRPEGGTLTLGPDLFVVEADQGLRTSWNITAEGKPPRLVLEVVTKESVTRDTDRKQKVSYYQAMGVEEYAIYWPYRTDGSPLIFGHRWEGGQWAEWAADANGVLWSRALGGLGFVVGEHPLLRVVDADGRLLPSPEEAAEQAEERAEREAAERRAAEERASALEAELVRLRALLENNQE